MFGVINKFISKEQHLYVNFDGFITKIFQRALLFIYIGVIYFFFSFIYYNPFLYFAENKRVPMKEMSQLLS